MAKRRHRRSHRSGAVWNLPFPNSDVRTSRLASVGGGRVGLLANGRLFTILADSRICLYVSIGDLFARNESSRQAGAFIAAVVLFLSASERLFPFFPSD